MTKNQPESPRTSKNTKRQASHDRFLGDWD